MADAAFNTGTIRTIAGYEVGGNAGLVGSTYNMNIWGLYATEDAQGFGALANALVVSGILCAGLIDVPPLQASVA